MNLRKYLTDLVDRVGYKVFTIESIQESTRGATARATLLTPDQTKCRAFLKLNREDPDCFAREAMAASVLEQRGLAVPELLFVSEASRLIAWKELASVTSVDSLLKSGKSDEVRRVFCELARTLAKVHSATTHIPIAPDSPLGRRAGEEARSLINGVDRIVGLFEALGLNPTGIMEVVMSSSERHRSVGPHSALTHGDQAPSNILVGEAGIWLTDFEFAAVRPALYDLSAWAVLCPLPPTIVEEMCRSYQAGVEAGGSREVDFEANWGSCCAFRALSMASWFGPKLVDENGVWAANFDKRSALAIAFERAAVADRNQGLVSDLLRSVAEAARARWPVNQPDWPALA